MGMTNKSLHVEALLNRLSKLPESLTTIDKIGKVPAPNLSKIPVGRDYDSGTPNIFY